MTSDEIKVKLLHYYRFKRRYTYFASEVGKFNADILVGNGKEIIELEVKTSKADLHRDFKKKKHKIYKDPSNWYKKHLPNKFYFAVCSDLVDEAKKMCKGTPYGVVLVKRGEIYIMCKKSFVKVIKQAKLLTPTYNKIVEHQIHMRMGSEIISGAIRRL